MLKCYYKYLVDRHDGERIGSTSMFVIEDESENHDPTVTDITWDNCDNYYGYGWYVYYFEKGIAAYFNDKLFPFAKEYKNQPLNITRTISYEETVVSINEIMKYRDSETAIQYLVERGLTVISK